MLQCFCTQPGLRCWGVASSDPPEPPDSRQYPPCRGTALRKNRPLVPWSNSRTTFFYHGVGFFMVMLDAGQLFRCAGQHFMCVATGPPVRGDPISQSQPHIPFKPLPPALDPKQPANDQCVDIIWAKAARGIWGLAHVFNNKLFLTRDIMDDDAVPMHFNVPESKPKPKPKPAPKPNAAPKPVPKGQHRQEFRMVYHRKKGFTSKPVEH